MGSTWIRNAQIVNEGRKLFGSVTIKDEYLTEILEGDTTPSEPCTDIIDAQGMFLIPGAIDEHVHFRQPGFTYKGNIASESRAAAAGGVTSVMDMPNPNPQTTTLETWGAKQELFAENSLVNYACYFGATNENTHLFKCLDLHRTPGLKLFMGASTGNMLVDRRDALERIFKESPLLIAAHCEDQSVINANLEIYSRRYLQPNGDLPRWLHNHIRSEEACYRSTASAIELATQTNARLHILHLSTAKELTLFDNRPLQEKQITAEACIPHLLMSAKKLEKEYAFMSKCNPAIKTDTDKAMLRQAVLDDTIDAIATDHAPHTYDEKVGGSLKAASGIPSIQYGLPFMIQSFGFKTAVQKMCHAPALLYQIRNRGFIRPGYKADLVLVSKNALSDYSKEPIYSKSRWSPFKHLPNYRVEMTFVNGHRVYERKSTKQPFDTTKHGQALCFR
ncbi:MAG: dihydroorotase [Prevotellaceae bacterium]|jgi:dihydroorotase|nr:dihydroorotase [Prevotellaceae bacterium]